MGKTYTHIKSFLDFLGIDLRSSDILRPRGFASDGTENAVHSPQGALTQRWGSHILGKIYGLDHGPYAGLATFETTDLTGAQKKELIGWTSVPYKLVKSTFTITNSDAAPATAYHFYDEAVGYFRFRISRGGTDIVDMSLGLGTEGSPVYLSTVESTVDGVSGLAMSTPALASNVPAAFMELLNAKTIAGSGGTLTVSYWYWEDLPISTPSGECVVSGADQVDTDYFRSVSSAVVGNVLYFSSSAVAGTVGAYYLLKYDGNRVYRAGMPAAPWEGVGFSVTGLTSPQSVTKCVRGDRTITSGTTKNANSYLMTLVNIDKAGNRVESTPWESGTGGSGVILEVTFDGAGSFESHAYNRAFARTSSAQTGVTQIAVSSGHTMQVGDVAFFWDNAQGRYIQRLVTGAAATQLTISAVSIDTDSTSANYDAGGAVNVLKNALITNNARIAVHRRLTSTGTYYLVEEIPNYLVELSTASAYGIYYDTTLDAELPEQPAFLEAEFPHDSPPTDCAFVSEYNGGLILSGNYKSPNTVYFSDVDGPEYFPAVTHNFDLPAPCTGHRQSGEFLVMGTISPPSLHVTSGVLSEFQFRVDQIGKNVGVTSHLSMQEFEEGVLGFSSNVGPYVLVSGRQLEPLGAIVYPDNSKVSRIQPFWTKKYRADQEQPVFKRAIATVFPDDKLYVLFVPFENPAHPGYATANSVTWVFDYGRGAWWKWTGLNMAGGIAYHDGIPYWGSLYQVSSSPRSWLYQMQRTPDVGIYNYADHDAAIPWRWRSHWESLREPSFFKRFLRIKIWSNEERAAASTTFDVNSYINEDLSAQVNDDTWTWTTQASIKGKLRSVVCKTHMIEFAQNARYQPMLISAYELEAVAPFRQEFKE